jgi:hypothetical protein
MKKLIISISFLMLCTACGIGAFFFFRKGNMMHEQEQLPKPMLIGLSDITIQEGDSLPESLNHVNATETVQEITVDTEQVHTMYAGIYPIYYYYMGSDGKEYQDEIRCVVEPKLDVPMPSRQDVDADVRLPKTGDPGEMVIYIILLVLSIALSGSILCYKFKNRKI